MFQPRPLSTAVSLLLLGAGQVHAGFDSTADNNVAVYWGQNSYGQGTGPLAQQRLSYYCQNEDIDIFPLAFMTVIHDQYGEPEINFANAGNNCTTFAGTALLDCGQLAEDIPTCQALNKTILLSIGGATYTEGGFSTPDAAVAAAKVVWNTFGPVNPSSNALRPFGNAAVDGFDFDFEAGVTNMAPFANELRSLMDTTTTQDGVHRFLTAAPQCPYPDYADNQILNGSVYVDAVFVQFYNNYCGLQSFTPSSSTQNNFNFATWDNWASTVSRNPAVKVLLGIPANTGAAGSGYEPPSTLQPIIDYCKQFKSFGGVMMWDSSQQEANTGFTAAVKGFLGRDQEDDTCKAAREGMRYLEKMERERMVQQKTAQEILQRERMDQAKMMRENLEQEKMDLEKMERKMELERMVQEKMAQQTMEQETMKQKSLEKDEL